MIKTYFILEMPFNFILSSSHLYYRNTYYRWSKTIVGYVDLTARLCLSFCLELQSAKSTYQHVDLDL